MEVGKEVNGRRALCENMMCRPRCTMACRRRRSSGRLVTTKSYTGTVWFQAPLVNPFAYREHRHTHLKVFSIPNAGHDVLTMKEFTCVSAYTLNIYTSDICW